MDRHVYTLRGDSPSRSRAHLAAYIGITILLTMFPMHYFTSSWLYCSCQFVCLNPFTFSPSFLYYAFMPPTSLLTNMESIESGENGSPNSRFLKNSGVLLVMMSCSILEVTLASRGGQNSRWFNTDRESCGTEGNKHTASGTGLWVLCHLHLIVWAGYVTFLSLAFPHG